MRLEKFGLLFCWHFIALIATTFILSSFAFGASQSQYDNTRCFPRKYKSMVNNIDDVEDLKLDVPIHIAFGCGQPKRFVLYLDSPSPLYISFSGIVTQKIFFNSTTNLSPWLKPKFQNYRSILLPCALPGQYDLLVESRLCGSIKIEAHNSHPQEVDPALLKGAKTSVLIRTQHRIGKGQMIIKWHKIKFDFHAVHYCLVVNVRGSYKDFCPAVNDFIASRKVSTKAEMCPAHSVLESVLQRPVDRRWKIDPYTTNVICTGNRTRLHLRGLKASQSYHLDLFGVHTQRQNATFHIASTVVNFTRTQPLALRPNILSVEKISGLNGVQVFSFKVPPSPTTRSLDLNTSSNTLNLRYLILPCGGSEVNAKIVRKRKTVREVRGIYTPQYIDVQNVHIGQRFMMRFKPSSEDDVLRANKVGVAVTTRAIFSYLPELPANVTVFEVRTDCQSATIAWYNSPDIRKVRYCIIVFNMPQRNRSAIDYTNYCLDFGTRIKEHSQFYAIDCRDKLESSQSMEVHTTNNLIQGQNYLIYVTAHLSNGKALPYQSVRVRTAQQCDYVDSQEQNAYD